MAATGNLAAVYAEAGELGLAHTMGEAAVLCEEELGYDDATGQSLFAEILMREGDLRAGHERMMIALRMPQNSPYQTGVAMGTAALYASYVGALETAAVLYGFSDQTLLPFGRPFTELLSPTEQAEYSVLQARLGESYHQYHERGRRLSWEAALALFAELGDSGLSP
jgi:hypothetical protein